MKMIKRYWFDFLLMALWIICGVNVIIEGSASAITYGCLLVCYLVEMACTIAYKELIYKYQNDKEKS